jgi:hypothetical protein
MREVIEAKGTNGRLTFDGVLVTIERGGARAWLRGTGIRSIPARAIVAVELKPAGLGRGWINFEVERDEDDDDLDDELEDDEDDEGDEEGGADGLAGLVGWTVRSARARRAEKAERFDPAKDPNTVIFTRGNQLAFEDVRRAVKAARWHASRTIDDDDAEDEYDEYDDYEDDDVTPTRPLPANDPVRELRQLGQLLQDGVLDRAEFERAKARLLDRI